MPPSPGSPKVEELRFRLKTDPKSRLFYPLAEELRKINQYGEAEQVLRTGLNHHPTYLSAWVSLGRVLREQGKNAAAVDALAKALQLDPGNVVAARLLADAYLAVGEKVEAIKKYKLVQALMPGDNDIEATIEHLERDLNPIVPASLSLSEMEPEPAPESEAEPAVAALAEALPEPVPFPPPEPEAAVREETPFATDIEAAHEVFLEEQRETIATADHEPMRMAHEESPFEEPVADFSAAAMEIEAPSGMSIEAAPLGADLAAPWAMEEQETVEKPLPEPFESVAQETPEEPADVFAPAAEEPAVTEPTDTITMADLYASQGLRDDARRIYETILQRDPENDAVRQKLAALDRDATPPSPAGERSAKVSRLEGWLSKVGRREVSHV